MKVIFTLLKAMLVDIYQYMKNKGVDFSNKDDLDLEIFGVMQKSPVTLKSVQTAASADLKSAGEAARELITGKVNETTKQKVEVAVNLYNTIKELYKHKFTYESALARQQSIEGQSKDNADVSAAIADSKENKELLQEWLHSKHSLKFMSLLLNVLNELEGSIQGLKSINKDKKAGEGHLLPLFEKQLKELRKTINDYLREKQAEKYMSDLEKMALNFAVELQKYRIKRGEQILDNDRLKPNIGVEPDTIDKLRLKTGNSDLTKRKLQVAKELYDLAHQFTKTKHPIEGTNLSWMEYIQPMYQGLKKKSEKVNNMQAGLLNTIVSNAVNEFDSKMQSGV